MNLKPNDKNGFTLVEALNVVAIKLIRIHKLLPLILGAITLASVVLLLVADMLPKTLAKIHHDMLGAVPLALIAIAYLLHQTVLRPSPKEVLKTVMVAMAFLFWGTLEGRSLLIS